MSSLRALAILRMTVFRNWPYLYDGDLDYETEYLSAFLHDERAVLFIARLGDIPVGMATASPFATQTEMIRAPFIAAGVDTGSIFYFGGSVLLPQFLGTGVGHQFFERREAAARVAGPLQASFCAVLRSPNHLQRPHNERDLRPFWEKRGYRVAPQFTTSLSWKEVGQTDETAHDMCFWVKTL